MTRAVTSLVKMEWSKDELVMLIIIIIIIIIIINEND